MSGLSRDAEHLLGRARRAATPSDAERRRVRKRLALEIAALTSGTMVALHTREVAVSAKAGIASAKVLATVAALAVAALGLALALHSTKPSVEASARQSAPAEVVTESPVEAAAIPVPAPTPDLAAPLPIEPIPQASSSPAHAQVQRGAPPSASKQRPSAPSALEEITLVEQIQNALRMNAMDRAMSFVEEHARRFPQGVFAEEREGARVIVQCNRVAPAEARGLGKAFLEEHSHSPLGARVREACAEPAGD